MIKGFYRNIIYSIMFFLFWDFHSLFSAEIEFNFNNDNNMEYSRQEVEVYKGKVRLSPTGFWTNVGGLISIGDVLSVLFQSSDGNLFLGSIGSPAGHTLYKSTNYNTNWSQVNTYYINDIIENTNGDLYCTDVRQIGGGGIAKSIDKGDSWVKIYGDGSSKIYSLLEDHDYNILSGCQDTFVPFWLRMVKSTNNGTSWSTISSNTNGLYFNSLFELNNFNILAQSTNGIYISTNSGTNWSFINGTSDLGNSSYRSFIRIRDNSIYVCGSSTLGRSIDEGKTWDTIFYNPTDDIWDFTESNDELFYKTYNSNVWKSLDKGYTWEKTPRMIRNSTNYNILTKGILEADNGKLYVGTKEQWFGPALVFQSGYLSSSDFILSFSPAYVQKWQSCSKSDTLNGCSITYEFSYSSDNGNTWSEWISLTDLNLQNVDCQCNGEDKLKIKITLYSLNHNNTPEIDWVKIQYDDKQRDNLDNVIVAPNPFRPYKNSINYVMFYNLTPQFEITIFSVGGGKVFYNKGVSTAGCYEWDVKNNNGEILKSGVYFCCIQDNDGHEKYLKLVVIR